MQMVRSHRLQLLMYDWHESIGHGECFACSGLQRIGCVAKGFGSGALCLSCRGGFGIALAHGEQGVTHLVGQALQVFGRGVCCELTQAFLRLWLLQQAGQRQFALEPLRLMRLVEQAALGHCLAQDRGEFGAGARR
ncbi:MAG: hypothetical protein QM803_13440 [Rhodocyclaceae bacterium]